MCNSPAFLTACMIDITGCSEYINRGCMIAINNHYNRIYRSYLTIMQHSLFAGHNNTP